MTESNASGDYATAIGYGAVARAPNAVAIGPSTASGSYSVAMGLSNRASAAFALALGKNASARHRGSIVISDASAIFSADSVYSTAPNQFSVRATGGIRMYTSWNMVSGVEVAPGGGSWLTISDRNRKAHFRAVDGEDVLARLRRVPVTTWNYRTQDDAIRHMGPMAQDFYAAFGIGEDSLHINTVDIDGVAIAGVQALEARTRAQDERIRALEAELAALHAERSTPVRAALPALGLMALAGGAAAGVARRARGRRS